MTIRHMKIFVVVAELGSMSAAAKQLFISQPAVSQAVSELETHYQTLLFDRLGHKLYITQNGEKFLILARQLLHQYDSMEDTMLTNENQIHLRIGSSMTVGTCLMPSIINEMEASQPLLNIYSLVNNTAEIEHCLLNSMLDAAVVEGDIQSPHLVAIPIVSDQLVLLCGKEHPFFSKQTICASDLNNKRFAMRENGSGTRKLFESYLSQHNLTIQTALEANCPRSIANALLKQNLLTVMSYRLVQPELREGRLKAFSNASHSWDRKFKLVYHKDKLLTPEIHKLKEILERYESVTLTNPYPCCLTD